MGILRRVGAPRESDAAVDAHRRVTPVSVSGVVDGANDESGGSVHQSSPSTLERGPHRTDARDSGLHVWQASARSRICAVGVTLTWFDILARRLVESFRGWEQTPTHLRSLPSWQFQPGRSSASTPGRGSGACSLSMPPNAAWVRPKTSGSRSSISSSVSARRGAIHLAMPVAWQERKTRRRRALLDQGDAQGRPARGGPAPPGLDRGGDRCCQRGRVWTLERSCSSHPSAACLHCLVRLSPGHQAAVDQLLIRSVEADHARTPVQLSHQNQVS